MIPPSGNAVLDWILRLLTSQGYLIVLAITVFENLFVVGSATPGETAVVAAAFVAAQGGLSLPLVWIASVIGTVIGSNLSFWFGHHRGRGALDALAARLEVTRVGKLFGIHQGSMYEAEDYFERHGSKTIFVSRFAWGLKNFMPVVAGASRMPVWAFELWTLLGAVVYTSAMCAVGWFLGKSFERAMKVAGSVGWVGLALVLAIVAVIVILRLRARRRIDAEEAAVEAVEAMGDAVRIEEDDGGAA